MTSVQEEMTEAMLDEIRERAERKGIAGIFGEDSETARAIYSGGRKVTSTTDEKAVIIERATGEERKIPATYLRFALKKRRGDGVKAFVGVDPDTGKALGEVPEPRLPELPCFLHPEHPDRETLVKMGIGLDIICGGYETSPARFLTEYDRGRHEESKHKHSYAIREKYRAEEKEREWRDEQRQATAAMIILARANAGIREPLAHECDQEGCGRTFDTAHGLKIHQGR